MTRNELRARDRFTFSLTGIPVVSSYASMPVIPSDRIRKIPKAGPTEPQSADGRSANARAADDALPAGCAG